MNMNINVDVIYKYMRLVDEIDSYYNTESKIKKIFFLTEKLNDFLKPSNWKQHCCWNSYQLEIERGGHNIVMMQETKIKSFYSRTLMFYDC